MKTVFGISTWAILLAVASPCYALWESSPVSKKQGKAMGIEVRSTKAGPNHVVVEIEIKTERKLKDFGWIELRFGEGDNPPLTVPLREDRSTPGQVAVKFTADRNQLNKIKLGVMVPEPTGGVEYVLEAKDFVELKTP